VWFVETGGKKISAQVAAGRVKQTGRGGTRTARSIYPIPRCGNDLAKAARSSPSHPARVAIRALGDHLPRRGPVLAFPVDPLPGWSWSRAGLAAWNLPALLQFLFPSTRATALCRAAARPPRPPAAGKRGAARAPDPAPAAHGCVQLAQAADGPEPMTVTPGSIGSQQ